MDCSTIKNVQRMVFFPNPPTATESMIKSGDFHDVEKEIRRRILLVGPCTRYAVSWEVGEASGKSQLDWYFESDICEALVLTDKRGTDEYAILTGTKVRSVNYG
eukprot:m.482310 g.482310  ORF g.482310 m.482310 type:complete len:104 (+) comp60358_c0_seq1:189-500(+)